jgi:hypothetical protein
VRGRGLFTSLDSRTVAGCARCVRRKGAFATARGFFNGLPSLGGLIAAPLYTVLNVKQLMGNADPAIVESLIRKAGLDPNEVRLDADGLVPAERRRLDIASFVASRLVWAEGPRAPKAFERALAHINALLECKLTRGRIGEILFDSRSVAAPVWMLSIEERAMLMTWLRELALADGPLTAKMSAAIHHVANALGYSKLDIAELFQRMAHTGRGPRGAEDAKRSAGANASSASGQEQKQDDPRTRRQRRMREDLEKARVLLGVTPTATYGEIERAYRTIIAACHPDRAGLDVRLQRLFTQKSQEITWAKDVLRRSFQAAS